MNLIEYREAVIAYLAANIRADIRQVKAFPARFDLDSVRKAVLQAPTVLVSVLGVPKIGLSNVGRFEGEVSLAAYIVCREEPLRPAFDQALVLAEEVASFISLRTFGVPAAHPAMVTRIDNLHTPEMTGAGISISAVAFTQIVTFGRDIYHEDEFSLEHPKQFDVRTVPEWPEDWPTNEHGSPGAPVLGEEDGG